MSVTLGMDPGTARVTDERMLLDGPGSGTRSGLECPDGEALALKTELPRRLTSFIDAGTPS